MSYNPQGFGRFNPTGCVVASLFSAVQANRSAVPESSPKLNRLVVPARHAYSHSASEGSRYSKPAGRRPASRSRCVSAEQYLLASRKETFSTGRLESPVKWLGFLPRTAANSPWVTSYFPIQKSRVIVTGYLIRMNVPALMATMLVTGDRSIFGGTGAAVRRSQ